MLPAADHADPFEQGKRAAKEGIPADANPCGAGTGDFALRKDGHELVAGENRSRRTGGIATTALVIQISYRLGSKKLCADFRQPGHVRSQYNWHEPTLGRFIVSDDPVLIEVTLPSAAQLYRP